MVTAILSSLVFIEIVIIIYLAFFKKNKVIKEVTYDFDGKIHVLKQKISALKIHSQRADDKNKILEDKIKKLEEKLLVIEDINKDLTKKKEELAEQKYKLEILQKRKSELFAIAIHDIKNPLAAIKSYLELLESYDLSINLQYDIIHSMVESSNQIFKLTNDISDIIAKEEAEYTLNLKDISLKEIIDSVCSQNFAYAKSKKIKLTNKSSMNTPRVLVDPDKMKEVLDNLVNNAIKYGPEGTNVHIITFFTNKSVTLEVSDDGVGLSDEDQKKVFLKGEKLTPKPTGNETSTGLGLWIAKTIVEEHGGKVFCVSKLGSGTTFGIELPIRPD